MSTLHHPVGSGVKLAPRHRIRLLKKLFLSDREVSAFDGLNRKYSV